MSLTVKQHLPLAEPPGTRGTAQLRSPSSPGGSAKRGAKEGVARPCMGSRDPAWAHPAAPSPSALPWDPSTPEPRDTPWVMAGITRGTCGGRRVPQERGGLCGWWYKPPRPEVREGCGVQGEGRLGLEVMSTP